MLAHLGGSKFVGTYKLLPGSRLPPTYHWRGAGPGGSRDPGHGDGAALVLAKLLANTELCLSYSQ